MSTIHACWLPESGDSASVVTRMLSASGYWEPDRMDQVSNKTNTCSLAKASLYNTQISKHDSVYHDDVAGLTICANAWIDNRDDLIRQLALNAEDSGTITDSQLILRAYRRWDDACPARLRGDFVFVIWDENRQRLFCARDHFGAKILFYSRGENGVMISNEHNAFFTSQWQPKIIKEEWIINKLWVVAPVAFESPYAGIDTLPPAHAMVVDCNGISITRYWQLEESDAWQGMDDQALLGELKNRFQTAVKCRLASAYPIGAELSEGIDSNGIAGYAAKLLGDRPLHTFSFQCEKLTEKNKHIWQKTYRELDEMLAMHGNLAPVWWDEPPDSLQLDTETDAFFRHFGGILDVTGFQFIRCIAARHKGVRTMLSGWGGDHCVSSYGDFYESELFSRRKYIAVHKLLRGKYRRGRGSRPTKAWLHLIALHAFPVLYRQFIQRRNGLEHALLTRAKSHFLRDEYIRAFRCDKKLNEFVKNYKRRSVKDKERLELFEIGLERRLSATELIARQFRIEYRYPMLDVDLVEFAHNLPGHLKILNGVERYAFRQILDGVTSHRIQWRMKADVDLHSSLMDEEVSAWKTRLAGQLKNSELIKRYGRETWLDRYFDSSERPMLIKLELLTNIEKSIQRESVRIESDRR